MAFNPVFNELLVQWGLNVGTPTRPTAFWVAFHTADPGTTGASEHTGIARTSHAAWVSATADGSVENDGAGESAADSAGATITHFSVWSAVTAGTYYFGGALAASKPVGIGDTVTWADAALVATVT